MLVSKLAHLILATRTLAYPEIPHPFLSGNQTSGVCSWQEPYHRVYICPPYGVLFTSKHVLDTIAVGTQSIFNLAQFSRATAGSSRYPHIFRSWDTTADIKQAISDHVSELPMRKSMKKWRTKKFIVEYPLLPTPGQYWEPEKNIDPGMYRILAQRDPVHPNDWVLCAVVAHGERDVDGSSTFELCDELMFRSPDVANAHLNFGLHEEDIAFERDLFDSQ